MHHEITTERTHCDNERTADLLDLIESTAWELCGDIRDLRISLARMEGQRELEQSKR